jgi:hypothetical protein
LKKSEFDLDDSDFLKALAARATKWISQNT